MPWMLGPAAAVRKYEASYQRVGINGIYEHGEMADGTKRPDDYVYRPELEPLSLLSRLDLRCPRGHS
jgi:hypothetical protein